MGPYAFFQKQIVPLEEAKVSVVTHALHYGTACFEGIRGNWNAEEETLYLFRLEEHFDRLLQSCKIIKISLPFTAKELSDYTVQIVEQSAFREDIYVRPLAYKSSTIIGVRLHNLEDDVLIFAVPFGNYLDPDAGARCATSSWRRIDDNSIPARAKITGGYINSALAKTEANENGFDEAILLNQDGHVSEGSGENIFIIRNGVLITPPPSDNILVGITRDSIMKLAKDELGLSTVERTIDRTELYTADECFMTGTAAHLTPVVEVDRRAVGNGSVGPISRELGKLYFDIVRGVNKKYIDWCTPVRPVLAEVHA